MNTITVQTKLPTSVQVKTQLPTALTLQSGDISAGFPYTFPFYFNETTVKMGSIELRGH